MSVRKAPPLCYPLFSMETDWSPLTFSNRGDRRKPVPNGGGCPVFHPGEKFRRTTPKGGGHSVLSDDRRRLRKDRPFWPFHASDSETLIVRHLVAWQSPSRVNSEIFNRKILDRVGPRRDSPALPKRPPLLHPVLVQILLSVCICLARGFVDSSGQDRGPNFRSGGCLSG